MSDCILLSPENKKKLRRGDVVSVLCGHGGCADANVLAAPAEGPSGLWAVNLEGFDGAVELKRIVGIVETANPELLGCETA